LPAQARQAERITLQTSCQHSDGDHQKQPIDALRFAQIAAFQLKDPGFLIAEQLLTAEAALVAPDQIQRGISVTDQIPGLCRADAHRSGEDQVGPLAAMTPEPDVTEAPTVAAVQVYGDN